MATHSILSLASGGGGLDAGVALALSGQARTVCFVENEVTAARALVAGMEAQLLDDAPIWSDLKTFDGRGWRGLVEGIIGGYPCQPFSVAGRRRGAADPRHLWPYIADIIRAVEPRWCFFENVGGHLRLGFREVADELRGMGYRVAATLWRAEEVGAPHRRERLFILAVDDTDQGRRGWRTDAAIGSAEAGWRGPFTEGGRSAVADASGSELRHEPGRGSGQGGAGQAEPRHAGAHVAHAYAFDDDRSRHSGPRWRAEPANGNGAVGNADLARLGGRFRAVRGGADLELAWPPGPKSDAWRTIPPELWPATPQPAVRGVVDGAVLARTDWLRILGNGVVPEQAAAAFRELWEGLGKDTSWGK